MSWAAGIIGGISAISASCMTHPMDSVKVRAYLYGEGQRTSVATMKLVRQMYHTEGFKAFYAGLSANVLRQFLFSTSRFGVHNTLQGYMGSREGGIDKIITKKLMSSTIAGAIAAAVSCPADVVMVRMQADGRLDSNNRRNYRHVLEGLRRIVSEEGIQSLWRGLTPLLSRSCIMTASQFTTYEIAKLYLENKGMESQSMITHLIAGSVAGVLATIAVNPFDVVKARMMQAKVNAIGFAASSTASSSSMIASLSAIIRTEGAQGLTKGLAPNMMRNCPQVTLMWIFYEFYSSTFKKAVTFYYSPTPIVQNKKSVEPLQQPIKTPTMNCNSAKLVTCRSIMKHASKVESAGCDFGFRCLYQVIQFPFPKCL
eukprot:NODE_1463_length_1944_cov_49.405272_g1241_i0.p1 GENE.NODE_1463_length_1944_cov_49.405272_g1241_i0~~NODE_1463_length_1944_cov_49.405272_g1241_i0.p1  ORF type:complete len:370 (+),score=29.97 NODE_1463_length_1944_cov_49.405272_g1241_i0:70-1179(+)